MIYKYLIKPVLFLFNPEIVHETFMALGELMGRFALTRSLVALVYKRGVKKVFREVDGITYYSPVLLSAGFDYNARLTQILPSLGLGGVEVGSVTARPCAGNPSPQLKRLPALRSIVVNKGLMNDGVDTIIKRLKKRKKFNNFVIGVSIARTNDDESSGIEAGVEDYLYSLRRLIEEEVGDYYTLNISCPNAFTGEMFLNPIHLSRLLEAVAELKCVKPIYVKMPLHLSDTDFLALVEVIANSEVRGLVIGNLNKSRPDLGNLSGGPCFEPSNHFIKLTRERYQDRFTIFGVGGIFSPADAKVKLAAGADLLQLITGMIYEGPGLLKRLNRAL